MSGGHPRGVVKPVRVFRVMGQLFPGRRFLSVRLAIFNGKLRREGKLNTATIIGSGPNGLSAGIVLASAGLKPTVYERNPLIGGGCSTAETTLPGFRQDLGSSVYPLGKASPFFRSLPIEIPWIEPEAPIAHPLDDGTAIIVEHSLEATLSSLETCDREAYRALVEPLARDFANLISEVLAPIQHVPRHPFLLSRFGRLALSSASSVARSHFREHRAQALFAGVATHSILPLDHMASAAVALVMLAAAHAGGWPIVRGGAQSLSDCLAGHLQGLGGTVITGHEVQVLPDDGLVLADVTPRQLLRIARGQLPSNYVRQLERFRYGPGAFKIDYALSSPIPWKARECSRAATVHLGGSLSEIVDAERTLSAEKPFVLLGQPSLFDGDRAPAGKHTAWAYCHVPNGATRDYTEAIENQISRFAPDFRDCVLARSISTPLSLERWNPNLIGGDIIGGAMDLRQLLFRPARSLYRTPKEGLYLCGASTPPGGGVHGMCGFHAAHAALGRL